MRKFKTPISVAQINDINGDQVLQFYAGGSAVNYVQIANSSSGIGLAITAMGTDTNINIDVSPKGTGRLRSNGVYIPTLSSVDALTNKDISSSTNTMPNGTSVGFAATMSSAVASGTTVLPYDDTIPQITEGTEFITLTYTPKSTTNLLQIQVTCNFSNSVLNDMSMALFQDANANALMAIDQTISAGYVNMLTLTYSMVAGTTSATTFRVRAGGSAASTTTFNGVGGPARRFGAIPKSSITLVEYKA